MTVPAHNLDLVKHMELSNFKCICKCISWYFAQCFVVFVFWCWFLVVFHFFWKIGKFLYMFAKTQTTKEKTQMQQVRYPVNASKELGYGWHDDSFTLNLCRVFFVHFIALLFFLCVVFCVVSLSAQKKRFVFICVCFFYVW